MKARRVIKPTRRNMHYFTVQESAEVLRITDQAFWGLIWAGHIHTRYDKSHTRRIVPLCELRRWIARTRL